jgi:hypothetical protein
MCFKNKAAIVIIILLVCSCRNKNTHNIQIDISSGNEFSENIIGKWHRNSLFSEAELTINNEMIFTIEAQSSANSGSVTGQLTKIKDGYYFSYINEYDSGNSCVIILKEDIGKIELIVYGGQVGAGAGVYYDGIYEPDQWTKNERIEIALNNIIGNYFDKNIVKQLLKDDLEYFVDCFGTFFILDNYNNKIIIEGWLRGVAPWQNEIIKIENNNIYILITDCREGILFRYYSTDKKQNNIPEEFINWRNRHKENIEKLNENNK